MCYGYRYQRNNRKCGASGASHGVWHGSGHERACYAGLTESEKEDLILRCRDAKTKEEMQRIVDSLVQDTDVSALEEIVQPKAMG